MISRRIALFRRRLYVPVHGEASRQLPKHMNGLSLHAWCHYYDQTRSDPITLCARVLLQAGAAKAPSRPVHKRKSLIGRDLWEFRVRCVGIMTARCMLRMLRSRGFTY